MTALTIHLLGVILGVGSAFSADALFFYSIRDRIFTHKELDRLALASRFVWLGVVVVVGSGLWMFFSDPSYYLGLSKFLAKMTIVSIVIINGAIFHFVHMPFLRRNVGVMLDKNTIFGQGSFGLFVSGGVSSISWIAAVALGALRSLPFTYSTIMGLYLLLLAFSITGALALRRLLLGSLGKRFTSLFGQHS